MPTRTSVRSNEFQMPVPAPLNLDGRFSDNKRTLSEYDEFEPHKESSGTFETDLSTSFLDVDTSSYDLTMPARANRQPRNIHRAQHSPKRKLRRKNLSTSHEIIPHELTHGSHERTSRESLIISNHPSLMNLVQRELRQREMQCSHGHNEKTSGGEHPCTFDCGKSFRDKTTRTRHENERFPQWFWFCTSCGDPHNAAAKALFIRKDKFVDHVSRKHPKTAPEDNDDGDIEAEDDEDDGEDFNNAGSTNNDDYEDSAGGSSANGGSNGYNSSQGHSKESSGGKNDSQSSLSFGDLPGNWFNTYTKFTTWVSSKPEIYWITPEDQAQVCLVHLGSLVYDQSL